MKTALFHNFTDKPFTGYWDGRAHKFKPGEKKYLQDFLAAHFAKHLTNQVLIEKGFERSTSPKFPEQVPEFMEIFNQACIVEDEEEQDEISSGIDALNREEPSMNIRMAKPKRVKGLTAKPKNKKEAVTDEEEEFEGLQ